MNKKLFLLTIILLFIISFIFTYNFFSEKYEDLTEIVEASIVKQLSGQAPKNFTLIDKVNSMRIIFKLNIPYLISEITNNLNDIAKEKINEYLEKTLSKEELKNIKNIFKKYYLNQ